jgi:short-subunit dehydrogenase
MLSKGLGLESAKQLAKMGPAKMILACRNMETAAQAVEAIKADGFADVEAWELDQGSFDSVNAFTKKYNESGLDLHVFLANAGIFH